MTEQPQEPLGTCAHDSSLHEYTEHCVRWRERMSWAGVIAKATLCGFTTPRVIHQRDSISVADVLALLEPSGHGALDSVEGAVWRVERKGQFDFMAKYVRPDKIDGIYLPEQSGGEAIWNWRP